MNPSQTVRGLALAAIWAIGTSPSAAEAEQVYESFDYAAGAGLDGLAATGRNLIGNYATSSQQDLEIAGPGLDYGSLMGNLPSVAGNRLSDPSLGGPGFVTVDLDRDVLIAPGHQIFFSALFTFDDTANRVPYASVSLVDGDSGDELAFGEPVVGSRAIRVSADTSTTAGLVSAGHDNAFVDGQTLWLIGHYVNGAAPGGDVLELLGYDTANAVSISPTFDLSDPGAEFAYALGGLDIDFEKITSIRFEVRGAANNFIDELRIGETYPAASQAVVPEPSTLLLLLLGLALPVCVGRRGRRPGRRAA